MNEIEYLTVGLNTINKIQENGYFEMGKVQVPVKNTTGEILIYIEASATGNLTVDPGNTVFGGMARTFKVPVLSPYLIRLEIGPHLIVDESGTYIQFSSEIGGNIAIVEMN